MNPIAQLSSRFIPAVSVFVLTAGTVAGTAGAAWAQPGDAQRSGALCTERAGDCTRAAVDRAGSRRRGRAPWWRRTGRGARARARTRTPTGRGARRRARTRTPTGRGARARHGRQHRLAVARENGRERGRGLAVGGGEGVRREHGPAVADGDGREHGLALVGRGEGRRVRLRGEARTLRPSAVPGGPAFRPCGTGRSPPRRDGRLPPRRGALGASGSGGVPSVRADLVHPAPHLHGELVGPVLLADRGGPRRASAASSGRFSALSSSALARQTRASWRPESGESSPVRPT